MTKAHFTGGGVDDAVPDLSRILTSKLGIDSAAFSGWLAPHLGRYRMDAIYRSAAPSRSEEIEALGSLCATLQAAHDALEFGAIPPFADALIGEALFRARREHLPETCERIRADLRTVQVLARRAQSMLQAVQTKPGRASMRQRDALFVLVVDQLEQMGIKKKFLARSVAADVLSACGVAVTDTKRAARKGST